MLSYNEITKKLCELLDAFCNRNYLWFNVLSDIDSCNLKNRALIVIGRRECYPNIDFFVTKSCEHFNDYKSYGHTLMLNHEYECFIMVDCDDITKRIRNGVGVSVFYDIYLPIKKGVCNQLKIKEDCGMIESLSMAKPAYKKKVYYTTPWTRFVYSQYPEIDRVIYNDPATIVFWKDGTKTVVKAQDCVFDPAVGLAMCFIKKTIGLKEFFKHLPEETEESP